MNPGFVDEKVTKEQPAALLTVIVGSRERGPKLTNWSTDLYINRFFLVSGMQDWLLPGLHYFQR